MISRRRVLATLALVIASIALMASSAAFHWSERRLSSDWRRLALQARSLGWRLDGDPGRRFGWPFGADLAIEHATLDIATTPGLSLTAATVTLHRPLLGSGPLHLRFSTPVMVASGPAAVRVWGDRMAVAVQQSGRVDLAASGLHAAATGGPDHVLSIRSASGTATRQGPDDQISLRLDALSMPLPAASRAERMVGQAQLDALVSRGRDSRILTIRAADLVWGGVPVHVDGVLSANAPGALSGRLVLNLGAGWREAIERAAAGHVIRSQEARASIGLLTLLSPGSAAHDLPLAVQDGRVTLGGLLLLQLPRLPPA